MFPRTRHEEADKPVATVAVVLHRYGVPTRNSWSKPISGWRPDRANDYFGMDVVGLCSFLITPPQHERRTLFQAPKSSQQQGSASPSSGLIGMMDVSVLIMAKDL